MTVLRPLEDIARHLHEDYGVRLEHAESVVLADTFGEAVQHLRNCGKYISLIDASNILRDCAGLRHLSLGDCFVAWREMQASLQLASKR